MGIRDNSGSTFLQSATLLKRLSNPQGALGHQLGYQFKIMTKDAPIDR